VFIYGSTQLEGICIVGIKIGIGQSSGEFPWEIGPVLIIWRSSLNIENGSLIKNSKESFSI
jgi:hypothetical protein